MESQGEEMKVVWRKELEEMGFASEKVQLAVAVCKDKQEAIEFIVNQADQAEGKVQEEGDFENEEEEDYKMIFVVRMDLKLSLNKTAELVATAALKAYRQIEASSQQDELKQVTFYQWNESGQKKIVVKSPGQKELLECLERAKLSNINYVQLKELSSSLKGEKKNGSKKVQVEEITSKQGQEQELVLALGVLGPASESELDPLTKHFKLL